jgi:sterol desaturase/sphingolipid hydroxylase (fatty acid hydroxylase superfamily)
MPQLLIEIFRLSASLAILVAIFVPLERLFAAHSQKVLRKEIWTDLGYYFLNGLLLTLLLSVPIGLAAWALHRVVPAGLLETVAAWPLWGRVLATLVASEVGYYWGHRLSHTIPFLWRFHAIHHSAEQMDFLVASRAHPLDLVFSRFCALVPIYVLGLAVPANLKSSQLPILVTLVTFAWGYFIHANLRWRLGPLEWLISTPGFHHWHHTRSGPIDRNFASTLPWLDWLFGTHYLPNELPAEYGIKARMPDSLTEQLAYPLFPQPPALGPPEPAAVAEIRPDAITGDGPMAGATREALTASESVKV